MVYGTTKWICGIINVNIQNRCEPAAPTFAIAYTLQRMLVLLRDSTGLRK